MLHRLCINRIVLGVAAYPLDINRATRIIDGHNQAKIIPLNVEYHATGTDNARSRRRTLQIGGIIPRRPLDLVDPRVQGRFRR